ncbi:MAG: quinone oxidoreductase [bacterium]|nr:quinone oxidoreductase [bacterium]
MTAEYAIVINAFGGPEALEYEEINLPTPAADEVVVEHRAIGVNFHDIYVRSGMYDTLTPPGIPGCGAAEVITAVGDEVNHLSVGDRVCYVTPIYGAMATARVLPARLAIRLPDELDATSTILVHAAAGGVGRLLCRVASSLGATVLGTIGSPRKAEIAASAGCTHTINYRTHDFVAEVTNLVGPTAVDLVYDSVGATTFAGSLEVLGIGGHLVNFGQSSGAVEPLAMTTLAAKSLKVSRPIIFHYLRDPKVYQSMADTVFEWFSSGTLVPSDMIRLPLEHASRAHQILEDRNPRGGSVVLIPNHQPL